MRTLLAVPCQTLVHADFMFSLFKLKLSNEFVFTYLKDGLVYDSRNKFAADAINGGFDRLMMIDSDMIFEPDILEKFSADMDTGIEYVSGIFTQRHLPALPCVYKSLEYKPDEHGVISSNAEHYSDFPKDTLFECAATGFGAVMMNVSLVRRIWDKYGLPFFPMPRMGEDLSFCYRATQMGVKLYCDSRVKVGHCGQFCYGEPTFLAYQNAPGILCEQEFD